MLYIDHKFSAEDVVELDEHQFVNCVFSGTRIVYSGSPNIHVTNSKFIGATWILAGAAATTMQTLAAIAQIGGDGREIVESIFQKVLNNQLNYIDTDQKILLN